MFGDLGKLIKLAGEMKQKMPEMQAKLVASTYTATAGGGAITASVNGKLQLVDLKIDPQMACAGDRELLEDMVKAAVSAAQAQAARAAEAAMKEMTGGMNLPGMDSFL